MRAVRLALCVQGMLLAGMGRTAIAQAPVGAPAARQGTAASATLTPSAPALESAPDIPFDPADLLFASPTRIDHIGRVVVAVDVNGQGPFRFIVDTGANYSTISPELATLLKLTPSLTDGIVVNGITGTAQEPAVDIARLQAGDLVMESLRVPVIWATLMAGAQGILGVADLDNDRLFVDFERNKVQIVRSGRAYLSDDFVRIPAKRLSGGLVSVDGRVGNVPVVAIIDTGAARSIANKALRDALEAHGRREVVESRDVYGATPTIASGELEKAPLIDFGDLQIGSVSLVFGDFHIFDVWGLKDRPALIIGMDILGTVRALSIDFREPAVYLSSKYNFGPSVRAGSPCRLLGNREGHCFS